MKTVTYQLIGGGEVTIEYDPDAPCRICGEPVGSASVGGIDICPSCDMGECRYCGMGSMLLREELDGGCSLRKWREHMAWHKKEHHVQS